MQNYTHAAVYSCVICVLRRRCLSGNRYWNSVWYRNGSQQRKKHHCFFSVCFCSVLFHWCRVDYSQRCESVDLVLWGARYSIWLTGMLFSNSNMGSGNTCRSPDCSPVEAEIYLQGWDLSISNYLGNYPGSKD